MSNVSITSHVSWPSYDLFLIVLLSSQLVYDPNPLRPNLNQQKPVSGSCFVRGLGWTLTSLAKAWWLHDIRRKLKKSHWDLCGMLIPSLAKAWWLHDIRRKLKKSHWDLCGRLIPHIDYVLSKSHLGSYIICQAELFHLNFFFALHSVFPLLGTKL